MRRKLNYKPKRLSDFEPKIKIQREKWVQKQSIFYYLDSLTTRDVRSDKSLKELTYKEACELARNNPNQYWTRVAYDGLFWHKKFDEVSNKAKNRWFIGGEVNLCYNSLDQKISEGFGDEIVLYYDSAQNREKLSYTYKQIMLQVNRLTNVLTDNFNIKTGNRVFIYMPNIPQGVFTMLACSRIGAIFCMASDSIPILTLMDRIQHFKPQLIVMANQGYSLNGSQIDMDKRMREIILKMRKNRNSHYSVENFGVLIYTRPNTVKKAFTKKMFLDLNVLMTEARESHSTVRPVKSDHPLSMVYTSGTTGDSKCIMLPTAGMMVMYKFFTKYGFGFKKGDVFMSHGDFNSAHMQAFFCFLPLLSCCRTILYEGNYFQSINECVETERLIKKYNVNYVFSTPTQLKVLKQNFTEERGKRFPFLKLWTTGGERFIPSLQPWVKKVFGCDLLNEYDQTELGVVIACPCLGFGVSYGEKQVSGETLRLLPGLKTKLIQKTFYPDSSKKTGRLVFSLPVMPGVARKFLDDTNRFQQAYLNKFPGYYDTKDLATIALNKYMNIESRKDERILILGICYNTIQMENLCYMHENVSEIAVVKRKDDKYAYVPFLFVKSSCEVLDEQTILKFLFETIKKRYGTNFPIYHGIVVHDLPRSRNGKLNRKVLTDMLNGEEYQIPVAVNNPNSVYGIYSKLISNGYPEATLPSKP